MLFSTRYVSAFIATAVSVVACASPRGQPKPQPAVERVQIQGTDKTYDMRLSTDERETKAEFEFPADSVWRAVPLAYAAMSIPTEGMDAGHRLFVGNVTARSRFNNQALSRLVNCGSSLTGLNADTYNILLRVQAQVDSVTPTESTLRTRLEASGTGFGGNVVNCTSTGELERQLSNQVKLLVLKQ